MIDEQAKRAQIIAIARSWLGTVWHHEARVKGAGVDCAQLLIAVYSEAHMISAFQTEHYAQDWMLHRDEPHFLSVIKRYCFQVDEALQGDIAMFVVGRQPAHGAIIIDEHTLIHAFKDEGCVTVSPRSLLEKQLHSYWRWEGFRS